MPDSHARTRSNSYDHLVSNTAKIFWRVNWVSDERRPVVAFFGMLFREQGVSSLITEDLPLQNASQFMFTPTSLGALLLSMQYKSLNLTRLFSQVRVWPARTISVPRFPYFHLPGPEISGSHHLKCMKNRFCAERISLEWFGACLHCFGEWFWNRSNS